MNVDILYQRIRERRRELKMTQIELARKIGYADHTNIAKIEKGLVDLPLSRVAQFADALGTTSDYLLGYDDERSMDLQHAIAMLEKMTGEELKLILPILERFAHETS